MSLALAHLPWILSHGPRAAVRLLSSGGDDGGGLGDELPIDAVLPLLEGRGEGDDVRWEYLRMLVHGKVGGGHGTARADPNLNMHF